jgi:hypothetical protein
MDKVSYGQKLGVENPGLPIDFLQGCNKKKQASALSYVEEKLFMIGQMKLKTVDMTGKHLSIISKESDTDPTGSAFGL